MIARLRRQEGVALPEILTAIAVLLITIVPVAAGMAAAKRSSLVATRNQAAAHAAQAEIEAMKARAYNTLVLTADPVPGSAADATDPNGRVLAGAGGPDLRLSPSVVASGREKLVGPTATGSVPAAGVATGPDLVTVGSVRVRVYRYITWRSESCATVNGANPCGSGINVSKRLTVAAVPVTQGGPDAHPGKPTWLSTVVVNPSNT